MNRRTGLWTLLVAALAVGGIIGWRLLGHFLLHRVPGATLVLAIDAGHAYDAALAPAEARRRTFETLRARVEKLVPSALVRVDGDRIEILLPRGVSPAGAARLLTRSGRLEFTVVDEASEYMKRAVQPPLPDGVSAGADGWSDHATGKQHADLFLQAPDRQTLADACRTIVAQSPLPPERAIALEHRDSADGDGWRSYLVFAHAGLTGERITDAEVAWDPQTGRPEVALAFDPAGARAFADLTEHAIGNKLAILLEGEVTSAPVVEGKIAGGRARITMGGTRDPFALQQEAKDLVAVLRVGSLAAPVTLVETRPPPE